jgi:hypothetical protein
VGEKASTTVFSIPKISPGGAEEFLRPSGAEDATASAAHPFWRLGIHFLPLYHRQ